MSCTKAVNRASPTTAWQQQGIPVTGSVASRRIQLLGRTDGIHATSVNLVGRGEFSFSNGGGVATDGRGWDATLRRYSRWINEIIAGAPSSSGYHTLTPAVPWHAILDPALPILPVVVRVRDVICCQQTAGVGFGTAAFTLGQGYAWQDAILEAYRSVGFHSYGGGTWRTYMSGNATNQPLRTFDTGIAITTMCELMFEIDGVSKVIRYYIDGLLVDTFALPADAGAIANPGRVDQLYWTVKPNLNTTLRFHHGLGIGPLIEVEAM